MSSIPTHPLLVINERGHIIEVNKVVPPTIVETVVIGDLADEVAARQAADAQEAAARTAADDALDARIDTEHQHHLDAETALNASIAAETSARTAADTTLQNNINTEQAARIAGDTAEATARTTADTTLQANIDAESAARAAADTAETTARTDADTTLQANIDAEATARTNADTTLQSNIDTEEAARIAADANLQQQIDDIESGNDHTAAHNQLQANIDAEATARADADTTLQNNIDAEATNRTNADNTLQSNIDAEAATRLANDDQLASDIIDGDDALWNAKVNRIGDTITGDLIINGNLTVDGTTTSVNSTDLEIEDNTILLNKGETGAGVTATFSGIEIDRGTVDNAQLLFDETDDFFKTSRDGGTTKLRILTEEDLGSGAGLDADTIDGLDSTQFLRSDVADIKTVGDLVFNDNVKATFGTDSDFSIYFDGTNYKLKGYNNGAALWFEGDNASGAAKSLFHADPDGATTLYHKGVANFQTDNEGANVLGQLDVSGNVNITPGTLSFGSSTRQMLHLYGTNYGIGIQASTLYFRSANHFSWHVGGTHSDTANDPGTGGVERMRLNSGGLYVTNNLDVGTDANIQGQISFGANDITFGQYSSQGAYLRSANTAVSRLEFQNTNSVSIGHIYGNTSGQFGLLDADSNWAVRVDTDASVDFLVDNTEYASIGVGGITGDYGSVFINGGVGKNGWPGISINSEAVFMANAGVFGLYDDTNNQWALRAENGGLVQLHHAGVKQLETTAAGVWVPNLLDVDGGVDVAGDFDVIGLSAFEKDVATLYAASPGPGWQDNSVDQVIIRNTDTSQAGQYASLYFWASGNAGNSSGRMVLENGTSGTSTFHWLLRDNSHVATTDEKMTLTSDGDLSVTGDVTGAGLGTFGNITTAGTLNVDGETTFGAHNWRLDTAATNTAFFKSNSATVASFNFRTSDDVTRGSIYGTSSNQIGLLNHLGQWVVRNTGTTGIELLVNNTVRLLAGGGGVDVTGNLTVAGDIVAYRAGGTTGAIYLNQAQDRYLYWDNSSYHLNGAGLHVGGDVNAEGSLYFGADNMRLWEGSSSTAILTSAHVDLSLLQFRTSNNATQGSVYGDANNGFGLLDPDGNWIIRHLHDSYTEFRDNNEIMFKIGVGGVTGTYGTVETAGAGKTGWDGYNIHGTAAFIANSSAFGLLDDLNEQWAIQATRQGAVQLYHAGVNKLATRATGVDVTGDLNVSNNLTVTKHAKAESYGVVGEQGAGTIAWLGATASALYKGNPTNTGAIKITLPTTYSENDMIQFKVNIYEYESSEAQSTYTISGYTYINGNTWVAQSAHVSQLDGTTEHPVRFGDDGTNYCVWIGELTHVWNYVQVAVTDIVVGHTGTLEDHQEGWDISIATSFDTVEHTHTNVRVAASRAAVATMADDSQLLDGIDGSSFLRSDINDSLDGQITTGSPTTNKNAGIYGNYHASHINHIWSIGNTFAVPEDGSTFGNIYGLAYYHPNNGSHGEMAGTHQVVLAHNGVPKVAMGSNLWVAADAIVGAKISAGTDVEATGKLKFGGSGFYLQQSTASDATLKSGSTSAAGLRLETSDGIARGYLFSENDNDMGLLDKDRQWFLKHIADSHTEFQANGVNQFNVGPGGVSGGYGTVETKGTGTGGWQGYNINGDAVFMSNAASIGLYDDANNEWILLATRNAAVNLYYNGSLRLATTNTGVNVTGDLVASDDVFGDVGSFNSLDTTGGGIIRGMLEVGKYPVSDDAGQTNTNTAAIFSARGITDHEDPETTVIRLMRDGTGGVIYASSVDFDVSRYEDAGVQPRTQLDIKLAHSNTVDTNSALKLRSSGDAIIGNNLEVTNDAIIYGDLTVQGTTTAVNSTDLDVEDNNITLNKGEAGAGVSAGLAGIVIDRGTLADAHLLWNETLDDFTVSLDNLGSQHLIWHGGNMGAGSGLDADTVDGYHAASATDFTGNRLVTRNASGYIYANHINLVANDISIPITRVSVETANDKFVRWATLAEFQSQLDNVANAQLLDNLDSTQFLRSDVADAKTAGDLTFNNGTNVVLENGVHLKLNATNAKLNFHNQGFMRYESTADGIRVEDTDASAIAHFRTDGTKRLNVYGDITTTTNLDVAGDIYFGSANHRLANYNSGQIRYYSGSGTEAGIRISNNAGDEYSIWHANANQFSFYDGDGNIAFQHHRDNYTEFRANNTQQFAIGIGGVSGDFGSVETKGAGKGGYAGYNINGNAAFMSNGSVFGLYDDTNNNWGMYSTRNGDTRLFYNGVEKLLTTDGGIQIVGAADVDELHDGTLTVFRNLSGGTNADVGDWNPMAVIAAGAGKGLYPDEEFTDGFNSISIYNNLGGTALTYVRENTHSFGQPPNKSGYAIKLSYATATSNGTSPGFGGFVQAIPARENATFVQVFKAMLPVGRSFIDAQNSMGNNNRTYWLTSQQGTGKFEWYVRVTQCGDSGTFSSGGHVYVSGGTDTSFDWWLASCNCYDITDVSARQFRDLTVTKALEVDGDLNVDGGITLANDMLINQYSDLYVGVRSNSTSTGFAFRTSDSATRGFLVANTGNQIGFADSGGSWAIQHINDQGTIFSDTGAETFRIGYDLVTGEFGTVQTQGGGKGGYEGYSINGRAVFMHDGASAYGLYDDVNNQWAVLATFNGATAIRYAGANKLVTSATGVTITGTATAATFSGALAGNADTATDADKLDGLHADAMSWGYDSSHGTYNDFNAFTGTPKWGAHFIQGTTNGPGHAGATQYYHQRMSVGASYTNYSLQLAFPRNRSDAYIYYRNEENGVFGGWYKFKSGDSDLLDGLDSTQFLRSDTSDSFTGDTLTLGSNAKLRITAAGDVSPTSTNHAFQIGSNSGLNMAIDDNEIMARNNNTAGTLYLQNEGGSVHLGAPIVMNGNNITNAGTITGTALSGTSLTLTGNETITGGDLRLSRTGGTTSAIYMHGSSSTVYLYYDGTAFHFSGGNLNLGTNDFNADVGTFTGRVTAPEFHGSLFQKYDANMGWAAAPTGAYYKGNSSQTGAIKVEFPVYATSDMVSCDVNIFDYVTDETFTVKVAGYLYQVEGQNEWVNCSVQTIGSKTDRDFTVRFGAENNKHCIWIGETTSVWTWLMVHVTNVMAGYTANIESYTDDWNITVETVLGSVNNTFSNNFPQAKHATTAGDADTVDNYHATTASTVSTVAVRDANGDINARLFRSEYDTTNPTIGYIMTQVDTVSNNYVRPSTPAQFRSAVTDGIYATASHNHDADYVDVAGDTMTGILYMGDAQTRVKLSVWNSSLYGIGMKSSMTYGGLSDYAMTFQMNNTAARGWWWGTDADTDAQGSMSLTTAGTLTVKGIGYLNTTQRIFADDYHPNADKLTTARSIALGGDVTGSANFDGSTNITITATVSGGDADTVDGLDSTQFLRSDTTDTLTGNLYIDNAAAQRSIRFKSGSDEVGIYANANNDVWGIYNWANSHHHARFLQNGGTELHHAGDLKLATTSTGVTVTGTVTATTFAGNATSASDADTVDGYHALSYNSFTSGIVTRHASGYIFSNYFNMTANDIGTSTPSRVPVETNSDGYLRWQTWANFTSTFLKTNADGNFSGKITTGTTATNTDAGIYGMYDSTKTHHIWSMGTAYKISSTGVDFGNLYGLAYKHTNNATGGTMASGHQGVWCENGIPRVALGTNLWVANDVIVGDDVHLTAGGVYWVDTVRGLTDVSGNYGSVQTVGAGIGSYEGYSIDGRAVFMHDGTTITGIYNDVNNHWLIRCIHAAEVELYHNNAVKLETTSTGVTVTGTVTATTFSGTATNAALLDNLDSTQFLRSDAADIKTAGTLTFNDSVQLTLGTSNDLKLYHNGTHSYFDALVGNLYIRDNATTRFTFARTTGDFTATGNVTAYSDERLKENIKPIDHATDIIKQLDGVAFTRKEDGRAGIGLIAQQVKEVLPQLVAEDEDGYLSVAYGNLVGVLVEGMKEQQTKIDRLEAMVEKLMEKIDGTTD